MKRANKTMQIYEQIRSRIESGALRCGDRLPSIRACCEEFGVAKGTAESAYAQLTLEGYVQSEEKRGFYVRPIELPEFARPQQTCAADAQGGMEEEAAHGSDGICASDFDYGRWKKEMNRILDYRSARLRTPPHPRGELELRREIARFVSKYRAVRCTADRVVVAAGTQILLTALAREFRRRGIARIAFEHPGFRKGSQVFEDAGFELIRIPVGSEGIRVDALRTAGAQAVYVSPAHQYPSGAVMSIANRYQILRWAAEQGALILEDDYDGMLRYEGSPIPSLQGLTERDDVVYLGSFSKLLSPSIRISYMILPRGFDFGPSAEQGLYNQSASTLEQLTLAALMADGSMERHLRRLRKSYRGKVTLLRRAIETHGSGLLEGQGWESGTYIVLRLAPGARGLSAAEFASICASLDLTAQPLLPEEGSFVLSYSGIENEEIDAKIEALCRRIAGFFA